MKIDWVPIDVLAEILVELAFKDGRGSTSVYHPLNPHPTTWDALLPAVIEILSAASKGKTIETVPFTSWIQRIRTEAETTAATSDTSKLEALLEISPAVKLLSFYEGLADADRWTALQTVETTKESEKLKAIKGIKPELMRKWAKGWLF